MAQRKSKPKGNGGKRIPKAKPEQPQPNVVGGCVVALVQNQGGPGQSLTVEPINGTKIREVPTLLRQGAAQIEKQLVGD